MLGLSWSGAADQRSVDFWWVAGLAGASFFVVLLVVLVVRALLQQRRYRVAAIFDEADRRAVHEALVAAERKTVGEILPVVVERSDPHPGADWLAALCFTLVGSALLAYLLPWEHPSLVLAAQVALGALGFVLARRLPALKRVFIFEARATEVAEEQAFQEFYRNDLHRTEAATGVLVFVSLLDRRVVILADRGIDSQVDADFWEGVDELVLEGIRAGSLRAGLVAGIERVGQLLGHRFPWREGDRNEVPDRVIVRRS